MKTGKFILKILYNLIKITVLLGMLALTTFAQTQNIQTAQDYFDKGIEVYKQENFSLALGHFNKSYQYAKHSLTSYFISCTYYQLNDAVNSFSYVNLALNDRPPLTEPYKKNALIILNNLKKYFEDLNNNIRANLVVRGEADYVSGDYAAFEVPIPQDKIALLTCYIINNANRDLNFQLSNNGNDWENYNLMANYFNNYNFGGQTFGYFRISTQDKGYVQYTLYVGKEYKLFWNQSSQRWDLSSI